MIFKFTKDGNSWYEGVREQQWFSGLVVGLWTHFEINFYWSHFKAVLAYRLIVSICLSIRLTSTFLLTFAFKFWNLLSNPALPSLLVSCLIIIFNMTRILFLDRQCCQIHMNITTCMLSRFTLWRFKNHTSYIRLYYLLWGEIMYKWLEFLLSLFQVNMLLNWESLYFKILEELLRHKKLMLSFH